MADSIARETGTRIGRILPPAKRPPPQKLLDLDALDVDQRPHDSRGGYRADARQPRRARAAPEPEQHRLRLVRSRMSNSYAIRNSGTDRLLEKRQPRLTGR